MNFKEIDYAVMEATMNVVASRERYRNKQHLIEDINNNVCISEEEYNELSTMNYRTSIMMLLWNMRSLSMVNNMTLIKMNI